jgi:hypothetical protein
LASGLCSVAGCVDSFSGSNLQLTLSESVQVPGDGGFGRPPANTHYVFYAVDFEFETDEDGNRVLDANGEPVVARSYSFKVAEFEVVPAIDTANPCFMEDDEARYPGVHVNYALDRLAADLAAKYGVAEFKAFDPPEGASPGDVIDLLTAEVRDRNLPSLQNTLKAIVSHQPVVLPAVAASCDAGADDLVPPPACFSDEANQQRKRVCERFLADNPDYYVGSDRVLTLPLNGTYFGMVDGADPRNNQFVGGAALFVDLNLRDVDAMLLNWQYNCAVDGAEGFIAKGRDDCTPLYPAGTARPERSEIGYHYMSGRAERNVRRVISVPMSNSTFAQLTGEVAIYPDLGSDDVHF